MLLDTHTLIWWLLGAEELSNTAHEAIATNEGPVWVSAVSAWEIATKYRIGKLPEAAGVAENLKAHVSRAGFETLNISFEHAKMGGGLPGPQRDPFDRLLIAQAKLEGLRAVTNDHIFQKYDVDVIW